MAQSNELEEVGGPALVIPIYFTYGKLQSFIKDHLQSFQDLKIPYEEVLKKIEEMGGEIKPQQYSVTPWREVVFPEQGRYRWLHLPLIRRCKGVHLNFRCMDYVTIVDSKFHVHVKDCEWATTETIGERRITIGTGDSPGHYVNELFA